MLTTLIDSSISKYRGHLDLNQESTDPKFLQPLMAKERSALPLTKPSSYCISLQKYSTILLDIA